MEEQDIDIIDRILEDFGANDDDDDIVDDAAKVEQFVLRAGEGEEAATAEKRDDQIYDTKKGRLGNDGIEKNTVEKKGWMQRRVPAKSINSDGSLSECDERKSDGLDFDEDNRRSPSEGGAHSSDFSEPLLREVVLRTISENERENDGGKNDDDGNDGRLGKIREEDVEMGGGSTRRLVVGNLDEEEERPSASTKSCFGGGGSSGVDGLMKAARGEYHPANSENNYSNDYGFDAFDLDDFMADFVPPEIGLPQANLDSNGNALKESEAQRKDRLKRNREAAQLSRARKKKQLAEFANAAKVFREQFLQSNALVGKLANENHVLRMHLAHLARFVTPEAATEAKKMNLPPLPPPTLAMQHLQHVQQQQEQEQQFTMKPSPVTPSATPGGKIMIPPFNPHAYAKVVDAKRSASERLGDLSPSANANTSNNNNDDNNANCGQNSNTNSPKRQRTKKSSVVATATALALSTACVLNNTNKAATVVARSGTAASIATNVGRLATRHLTALPGSFADSLEGFSEERGIIASPDLKQALEMNWTMPDQAEIEKSKHSKALAFASEAIKKLSFDQHEDDKTKVMNLWSEDDKEDKGTLTMVSDEEANKIDPWFAAFRAARMHDVIQKMSRVDCAEVFQYKVQQDEDEDANEQTISAAASVIKTERETPEQRIARKRASGAIPLDDGSGYSQGKTSRTVFGQSGTKTTTSSSEDNNNDNNNNNPSSSIVSMLLPPWEMTDGANDKSAAAMLRRLTKTFIVMFSKETGTYTTYACRLPIANL